MTYIELIELRKKLIDGKIALDLAKELYWKDCKEGKRSWHTKDWKERRSEVIKDKCQVCGSKETLTLQHLSHPKKYSEHEREVTKKYTQLSIDSNAIIDKHEFSEYLINNYDYVPVPLCPNCKGRHPNKRMRKMPRYLCTECRSEFDEPFFITVETLIEIFYADKEVPEVRDKCFISKDTWKNKHNLSQVKYWLQREKTKTKNSEAIGKETLLLCLDENIKYLSFEDTITVCKKCAFNYDLNNMELCPKCKEHYKGIQYPTCIQCLPEDSRKAALEKIEFGKAMQALEKELGID